MPNIVYVATSLDGFIARKDGGLDWLMEYPNPENSDYGFLSFMERIDGIIMDFTIIQTSRQMKKLSPRKIPETVFSHVHPGPRLRSWMTRVSELFPGIGVRNKRVPSKSPPVWKT